MAILSKQAILAANDQKIEQHAVPEWGGEVCIRNLRGWERDKFDQDISSSKDKVHGRAKLVAMCLCDKEGRSLEFTKEDILELSSKNAAPLTRLFEACCELSGLTKRRSEEEEKNSNGQSENSGENSPGTPDGP